jgi:phospholipase/lecithinase/hemolysin
MQAMRLPFFFAECAAASEMSPRRSAATRFRRQMATGFSSGSVVRGKAAARRQAGSQGRSQVRPRMAGNTFDSRLSM